MKLSKPTFNLNRTAAVLAIAVGIVLIAGSAWIAFAVGTDNGKQQTIQHPLKRQSLNGEVKSANNKGFTVVARGEEWKVKYTKTTTFNASKLESGKANKDDIKNGDQVRVIGVLDGDKTVIAQTITKVQPRPSGSPVPGKPVKGNAGSIDNGASVR